MSGRIHRTLLAALLSSGMALALPENGQVMQGNVQFAQPQNHILQILQSSPTGIINWGSFNIDANQLVQFLQPGAGSALLNRVIGQDPSQILGQIQANGRILLVNPNGILFGPGSTVNAGSFLATTLSIQDQDFLQGRYDLRQDPNSPLRAVVNQGEIRVTDGGFIALISPLVDNQGLLVAQQGQVVLGATTRATLQVDAGGLLQVSIPDGFRGEAQVNPQTVLLTQGQMSDTLAQLVRGGHPEGERIIETAQGIQLVGAEGLLVNQGTVRADALQGPAGGILMNSSQATVLTANSLLSASSAHGDAGSIYALSGGAMVQNGAIQARSAAGGNGGFVEVSGRRVQLTRGADLTASEGRPGHLLIDPDFITIVAAGGTSTPDIFFADNPGASLTVDAGALDLPGTTVTLEAELDLSIDTGVQVNLSGATDLVLSANRDFIMNEGSAIIAADPAASVTISANQNAFIRDLQLSNIDIQAGGSVQLEGTTSGPPMILGRPTDTTVLDVTADSIQHIGQIELVGNRVQATETATGPLFLNGGANVSIVANAANVSLTGGGTGLGVVFSEEAILRTSSAANLTLASPSSNVNFQDRSGLNLVGPAAINISTPAGGFFTFTGVSINATDPASRLDVQGDRQFALRSTQAVPTQNSQLTGSLDLSNTTVGTPASTTVLNATAGTISIEGLTVVGTGADIDLGSAGGLSFLNNSQMRVQPSGASVNMTAQDALVLGVNSTLQVDGPSDVRLTSNTSDVFLNRDSRLDLTGPSTVTINSPNGQTTFFERATINATNPASSVNISAGQQLQVEGDLLVPTIDMHSDRLVRLLGGTVGTPGSPTSFNVTGGGMPDGIAVVAGSNLDIQGTLVDITLTSAADVFIGQDSTLRILAPTANLVAVGNRLGGDGIFVGTNSTLSANGAANITLNANTGNVLLREGSSIQVAGTGDLTVTAPAGRVNMSDGASLNGNSRAILTARDGMDIGNLRVPTNHLQSTNGGIAFQNSTIGRPEAATVLNVSSPEILFNLNRTTQVVGTQAQVNLGAGNNVLGLPGSQLNLSSSQSNVNATAPQLLVLDTVTSNGAGNFSLRGGTTRVDTLLSAPGANSRAELTATNNDLSVAGLQIGNVSLNAANSVVFTGGTIGRPGSPTQVEASANLDVAILDNLLIEGSSVDFQLSASRDIFLVAAKSVTLAGSNNHLRWQAGNNTLLSTNSTITAPGPTELELLAGTNLIAQIGSSVVLPDPNSQLNLQSNGTLFVHRVTTGGNLSTTVTAGNVRLTDQLAANNLTLNISGELIAQPDSRRPALVGTNALNVTASRISGPLDDPESGLVKALTFATGPSAQVQLNVTGTNNTATGNRAANLLYQYPQSGNLVLVHPSGDVLLVQEPAPPEPPAAAPVPLPAPQPDRLGELAQLTGQSVNVVFYPFASYASASTQDLVFLAYDNAGLIANHPVSPNSALLERSILAPGETTTSEPNVVEQSLENPELTATQEAISDSLSSGESYSEWESLLSGNTVELVVLFPERSASELRQREARGERNRASSLLLAGNDEDEELRYWRKLIEGLIIWEE